MLQKLAKVCKKVCKNFSKLATDLQFAKVCKNLKCLHKNALQQYTNAKTT